MRDDDGVDGGMVDVDLPGGDAVNGLAAVEHAAARAPARASVRAERVASNERVIAEMLAGSQVTRGANSESARPGGA